MRHGTLARVTAALVLGACVAILAPSVASAIQKIPLQDGWKNAVTGCDSCVLSADGAYLTCPSQADWEMCVAGICAEVCPTNENGAPSCETVEDAEFCGYQ